MTSQLVGNDIKYPSAMGLFIRLTYKGESKETMFQLSEGEAGTLALVPMSGSRPAIELKQDNGELRIEDTSLFEEGEEVVNSRLQGLSEGYLDAKNQGIEVMSEETEEEEPIKGNYNYTPDDIYVENKPFSIGQLMELIEQKDLDLAPNFQRHFIWDRTRQSLLIESILLGLPLPSIYLSQFEDGMLTVVDGLQRIHTIKKFMEDKLRLCNLEYLRECNGKTFSEVKSVLSSLRLRRFRQTQLMCFVIDYRSPSWLKYDLFRRLNTGGKPLNGQEIRNCLSRPAVQRALNAMSHSEEFERATGGTVKDTRLQAQEMALRFVYFRRQYSVDNPIGNYNGKMEDTLNDFVDELNRQKDFTEEVNCFREAMRSAYYLFGEQAFRRVSKYNTSKLAVNKLLMLGLSVLLSFYTLEEIEKRYVQGSMLQPLQELIDNDEEFYRAITYGTNSKWNIETGIKILRDKLLHLPVERGSNG